MNNISNVTSQNNNLYVEGSKQAQRGSESKPLELKAGSTLQGTVVSVTDTESGKIADINVGDNMIQAKLREDMGLKEGQTLNFSVRSTSSNTVSITPLYENTSVDQSTLKALAAAGLEVTDETVRMVKDMMEAGLPINKDALNEMSKALNSNPEAKVSTLVEMKSLGIPINENNIKQYESYKNYEHQVTSAMEDIMDELPKAFSELVDKGSNQGAVKLYGSVLTMIAEGEDISESAANEQTGAVNEAAKEGETAETAQSLAAGKIAVEGDKTALTGDLKAAEGEIIKEGGAIDEASLNEDVSNSVKLGSEFKDSLRNLGVSENTINRLDNAAAGSENLAAQKALLKEMADIFKDAQLSDHAETAAWKKVFSGDEYNKIQKNVLSDQWLLKPDDVQKKENVDNLYQRLGNQAKALSDAVNSTLGAESKLGQTAGNLSNNLDFMNQLNQMFQYVQLPLQMTGQNVHGDLYVYRNKNKKLSEDGSVSAVLHLDMENLGPVDVYVKMSDNNKVSTNFYVADDSTLDLINDNIHILNERLEKRGYSMSVTLKLQDDMEGDAAVDEMLDVTKTPILSTNSFDARA